MNCTQCGTPVPAGSAFCPACGAPVAQVPAPSSYPQPSETPPPLPPVAPTQPMPVAQPQPVPAQPAPSAPQSAAPYTQQGQVASAYQQPQPSPRKGLSPGAIAAIVVGAVALLAVLIVAGVFVVRVVGPRLAAQDTVTEAPVETPETEEPAIEAPPAVEEPEPAAPEDGVVTDLQARDTVAAFMDARMARDVALSNSYCNEDFLNGEWSDLLADPTWYPERYEIVNTAPDLMYVHVVVLENWPSGDEYWIYSVYLDPDSRKPLIGGTIDPNNAPELIPQQ